MQIDQTLKTGPKLVVFAATYKCNFKCPHCPQPELEYFPKEINLEMIEAHLSEMKSLGWKPNKFQFHFFGESLLNKELPELIRITKRFYPSTTTFLSTNGSYHLNKVLEAGLDQLVVSIDGSYKEAYEKRRVGGKFERVINNTVDALLVENRGQVCIQVLRYDDNDFKVLRERFKPLLKKNDMIWAKLLGSWAGKIEEYSQFESEWMGQNCSHIGRTLVIDGDGECTICCLDIDRKLSIGKHFDKISLEQIWTSEKHEEIIDNYLRNSHNIYESCKTCYYRPEDPYQYLYIQEN